GRPDPVHRETPGARPAPAHRVLPGGDRRAGGGPAPRPSCAERLQLAEANPPGAVRVHRPHAGMGGAAGVDPVNEHQRIPQRWQELIDDYLDGLLDEARTRELEQRLSADAELRRYFCRYATLHTDLHLEARAHQATECVIGQIEGTLPEGRPGRWLRPPRVL